jgi:hypothetical protein
MSFTYDGAPLVAMLDEYVIMKDEKKKKMPSALIFCENMLPSHMIHIEFV